MHMYIELQVNLMLQFIDFSNYILQTVLLLQLCQANLVRGAEEKPIDVYDTKQYKALTILIFKNSVLRT